MGPLLKSTWFRCSVNWGIDINTCLTSQMMNVEVIFKGSPVILYATFRIPKISSTCPEALRSLMCCCIGSKGKWMPKLGGAT